jgi:uncharacterized protein YbcI
VAGQEPLRRPGSLNQAIADAVVRGHRRSLGRGPRRAIAFYHQNIVVVVLQDTLTTGERSLAADGRQDAVRQLRRQYESLMRAELVDAVEELTGCRVEALISGSAVEPDVSAQLFILDRSVDGEPPLSQGPYP